MNTCTAYVHSIHITCQLFFSFPLPIPVCKCPVLPFPQACQLPIFEYVSERMCSCCYERAWYAKLGGCCAIKIMMERMDLCWVLSHLYQFLKALLFVMLDLTGEVSALVV